MSAMRIQVSLSINIFEQFTYEFLGNANDIGPGKRIVIPFGKRLITGWVVKNKSGYTGKVKKVVGVIDENPVSDTYFSFASTVSDSYFSSRGLILDYSLSPRQKSTQNLFYKKENEIKNFKHLSLSEAEQLSKEEPIHFFYKHGYSELPGSHQQVSVPEFSAENRFVISYDRLDVYSKIIDSYKRKDQSVLITVPDRWTAEFWVKNIRDSDLYYSQVPISRREQIWYRYAKGESGVLIGGLSAIMLPIENLGCVISERAGSFTHQKSHYTDFNLNHIARIRSDKYEIPLIEGFSTFTSRIFSKQAEVKIEDRRIDKGIKVEVSSIPRKEKGIPDPLIEWLKNRFMKNEKILIIINKKKSSVFLYCQKCKKIQKCPSCGGILTVRHEFNINCTRCDLNKKHFRKCSVCSDELMEVKDPSIASMKEIVKKKISESGILTLTAEDMKDINSVLDRIEKNRIVIATPVLVNPFFKNLFDSIVYHRPESVFNMNEYNTGEMIFSMVSELKELVKHAGVIHIFSTFHFHYALKLIEQESAFFLRELKYRKWFLLPPHYQVYSLEVRSSDLRSLGAQMREIYTRFKLTLNINHVYLISRQKIRGKFKGKMEIHSHPEILIGSGLLEMKNVSLQVLLT